HNPPEFNGLKMVLQGLPFAGDDIQGLRQRIETERFTSGKGSSRSQDVLADYRAEIVKRIGRLPRPVRVVVDCGHATGSVSAPQPLKYLGSDVVELFCESDGSFPNHHPDPTVLENLKDLQASVRKARAELGIAFDGDADRIGAVDEHAD